MGERIDVALVDSVVSAMETIIQLYIVEGRIPGRIGNRYEFIAPYDSFATADGWVVIGVGGEEVWKRFCKAIGREDLLEDPRFETNRDRVREYAPLKDIVTEWTSKRNAERHRLPPDELQRSLRADLQYRADRQRPPHRAGQGR